MLLRPLHLAIIFLAAMAFLAARADDVSRNADARLARRAALVRELLDEGAAHEALDEAAALKAECPSATNALESLAAELALASGTAEGVVRAFRTARDPRVFRVAGAALALLFEKDASFRAENAALADQVDLCRESWDEKDWAEARNCVAVLAAPRRRGGPGAWLSAGVVGFYRLFVGPAIGNRCVLEPSCSRYYLEASRKHGVIGVPMIADRFVREPVVSGSDRLVRRPDGSWRHPDPVSDHDWWFRKEAK